MARNNTEQQAKSNNKLEAFLKRNLDSDSFERIRAHDACLVCSSKEDKAFKFVILSDEWIYLSENPPKNLYETIHLKDLTSVELINDFPEFLSGSERENAQHLILKYLTNEPEKKAKQKSNGKKRTKNKGGLDTTATSDPETPRSSRSSKPQDTLIRPYSCQSLSARDTREQKLLTARRNLSSTSLDTALLSTRSAPSDSTSVTAGSPRPSQSASPLLKPKSIIKETKKKLPDSPLTKQKKTRPLPPSKDNEDDGEMIQGTVDFYLDTPPITISPPDQSELKLDLTQLQSDESDDETSAADDSTSWIDKNLSVSTDGEQLLDNSEDSGVGSFHEATIHLYVMSGVSKIFMLIKAAQTNYLIRATREEDEEFVIRTTCITPRGAQLSREKLELLFRQLKEEMIHPALPIEGVFHLITELKVALQRNFALKKIFWKTPDVFLFFLRQMKKYLPQSPMKYRPEAADRYIHARADEIELVIQVLETMAIALRETDIIPSRVQLLRSSGGQHTKQLLSLLVCSPQLLPEQISSSCLDPSTDIHGELQTLLKEHLEISATVMFEVLMVAEQANWTDAADDKISLSMGWMINYIAAQDGAWSFINNLVLDMLSKVSSKDLSTMNPDETVLLYQQLYVLKGMVDCSDQIMSYLRNNFYEEFKYYVQMVVIEAKLPKTYLLRPHILRLLSALAKAVLQK